ncbi:CYTH-like domain-containing protein [Diplogelasinospora grovesii]|uniref:mRNA-capping enzyme subunit beta n=1 Tax=Diplogelasinospora grovesii TaxID=303347 RepID=A0AAN6N887_9PEZI|nr:CYTH-like domain-containing protein [Diplogelasinospora grovesii]
MDLKGILNDNGPAAPTPTKQLGPHHPQQQPSTPIQAIPPQSFRDYSQQPQQSPGRHISQDYGGQPQLQHAHAPPSAAFASPPPYSNNSAAGPYPNRPPPPPPPPLQPLPPNHDLRSPSLGSRPIPPSPYRQTPTSSISAASGGYPFPPTQPTPTSPVQRHQYPPPAGYHRDSFSQPSAPVGMTGPPGPPPYMQGMPMPQTPPVGTPGGAHPSFLHQRSQSSHSTPTPTSAQSQPPHYGAPFVQGSPVAMAHPLPQLDPQQQRQQSQPPTPIATPLSGPRQPPQAMGFAQPPSPYQQRVSGPAGYPHPPSQTSPPPPPPPSIPRQPSNSSVYDTHSHDSHRLSQSVHGDRDRSISVSPKTRVPSLPSSVGRPGTSISDSDSRHYQTHPVTAMRASVEPGRERASTPAKRKLDDRDLGPEELERREMRPAPFENVNGRQLSSDSYSTSQHPSLSHKLQKKRRMYMTLPIWAQALQGPGQRLAHPNRILYKPPQHNDAQVNGRVDGQPSGHPSPEEKRSVLAVQPAPAAHPPGPPPGEPPVGQQPGPPPSEPASWGPLGPLGLWEPCLANVVPQGSLSKAVADFLFRFVVLNDDLDEIQGRGVHFEVEAKLGMLIEKKTNQRVQLPVTTDCVLNDQHNWLSFRSSMSVAQHKGFNDFLNKMLYDTREHNLNLPPGARPRVPIDYKRRLEVDRFFEIPAAVRDSVLPACVAGPIAARGHNAKLRVTYDQKTNKVVAKIIKARLADISLHFPEHPLDCRISVNLEMDWPEPLEGFDDFEKWGLTANQGSMPNRNKNRLSYTHSHYQVDLTQVTQVAPVPNGMQRQDQDHELEIEVAADVLLDQGRAALSGQPHQYVDLVEGLINNIRLLARQA